MNTRKHGFTLTELLVVLAVLAFLAAILFPVFAQARRKARIAGCASNLHQVGLALHQYANDHDGDYPPDDPLLSHNPHLVWTLLMPYTKNADVFHCPDTPGDFGRGYFYDYGSMPYFYSLATCPVLKAPRPGSGTVVAECDAHTQRDGDGWALDANGRAIGSMIVVREDGSASQIQGSQIERWIYRQGQWIPGQGVAPQPGDWVRSRFPAEEWPPQD